MNLNREKLQFLLQKMMEHYLRVVEGGKNVHALKNHARVQVMIQCLKCIKKIIRNVGIVHIPEEYI